MNRFALFLLLLPALAACSRSGAESPGPDAPVPVRVASVSVEKIAVPVVSTGTLGAKEDVALSFKVGGVISRVLVDEGQHVAAGELLATLDFGEIDPAVARTRAAAEKAERDLVRAQTLYADSVATLEQVQDAATARDAARAEYEAATFNRRHAVITAPAEGVILARAAEPGEMVGPGTPVLTLASHARGQVVRTWLADRDVVRIHLGDPAAVRFDALPDQEFDGRVSEIAAAADPATGTYRVDVALDSASPSDGAGGALASGLVGAVEIRPSSNEAVAFVPADALLEADGAKGLVFTLAPDARHAVRRPVKVAFLAGDRVAIAAGLDNVAGVITDGAAYLDDGRAVEVQP